jgi:CubicO group peptidase (beta-lactamase class C family)
MPGGQRQLPYRPSLRYLKLEAKRRLAAGEFSSLHDAQAGIAREHGLPNWAALKRLCGQPPQESYALWQLRWVIARFRDAGAPGWMTPGDQELRQHFSHRFLAENPAGELVAVIASVAADLRQELVVIGQAPLSARVQIASLKVFASVEGDPPHRLTELQAVPVGRPITDTRVAAPPTRTRGDVPAEMAGIADEAFAELGLAALVLAGGDPDAPAWVVAKGWANLERAEALDVDQRFPAPGVTALVTATAVLRLIADGRLGLDTRANDHLRAVRLADDTITVRELLSHTAGVDSPTTPGQLLADSVPDLVTLTGPLIACGGPRGVVRPSNGGCAVLGQLIADVTGSPYAGVVTRLVLEPLRMSGSSFPARSAELGPDAVTGYNLTPQGALESLPARIATMPSVGGLWATPGDLVRLGTGWSSLLPAELAREALTPQTAPGPGGRRTGLGWLISPRGDVAMHAGAWPGATTSLLVRIRDNQVHLTMTNRLISLDPVYARVLRFWANPVR